MPRGACTQGAAWGDHCRAGRTDGRSALSKGCRHSLAGQVLAEPVQNSAGSHAGSLPVAVLRHMVVLALNTMLLHWPVPLHLKPCRQGSDALGRPAMVQLVVLGAKLGWHFEAASHVSRPSHVVAAASVPQRVPAAWEAGGRANGREQGC